MSWSYYLRIISSTSWAYSSSKIATLSVVSTLLCHPGFLLDPYRSFWIFMEVTADYSFQDFRSPFPAPRSLPRFGNIRLQTGARCLIVPSFWIIWSFTMVVHKWLYSLCDSTSSFSFISLKAPTTLTNSLKSHSSTKRTHESFPYGFLNLM